MENEKLLNQISEMMDRKLISFEEKMDRKFDEKLAPINERLDKVDSRLDKMQEDIEIIREDGAVTRAATNSILNYLEKVSPVNGWEFGKVD